MGTIKQPAVVPDRTLTNKPARRRELPRKKPDLRRSGFLMVSSGGGPQAVAAAELLDLQQFFGGPLFAIAFLGANRSHKLG